MKPTCACFTTAYKDSTIGDNNATMIACLIDDTFTELMADREMCTASSRHVMLGAMVLMMRTVANVEYRKEYGKGPNDAEERTGFMAGLEGLIEDLEEREVELQMISDIAEATSAVRQ